jgi:hypothetical protein
MDPMIQNLESTTFGGRRLSRKQIALIQDTVKTFPALSRRELAHTICEHLNLFTPNGRNKIQTCLNVLEELEKLGIITLPALVESQKRGPQKTIAWTPKTDEQTLIDSDLKAISPIHLCIASDKQDIELWNEFIDRYHYLGYRRPIGSHLRYFIADRNGYKLGCLSFCFATQTLPCRDQWIGWSKPAKQKRLNLVINNNRFLIFPWVKVKNLASKALSMACRQLPQHWDTYHGYRPVLVESFIDTDRYAGSCYRAANWQHVGSTAGVKANNPIKGKSKKAVYLYPLKKNAKSILNQGQKLSATKCKKQTKAPSQSLAKDDPFVQLWAKIVHILVTIANEFDRQWQKRQRVLNTLLLVLFIFRLVFSKNHQGYATTIVELWDQCRMLRIPLPQDKPVAASAFCNARKKMDPNFFKILNTTILDTYAPHLNNNEWHGHRMFAVDGSNVNLPRRLLKEHGYKLPSSTSYYPQGLVSCLYRLIPKLPIDFELSPSNDERNPACYHLEHLKPNDVVVYDRGYYSYPMLYYHLERNIHPIFRIQLHANKIIDEFIAGDQYDQVVDISVSQNTQSAIRKANPGIIITPLKLRLIKYKAAGETYILGTTLLDKEAYPLKDFPDVYHSRWGIEELYKISKDHIEVEDFHGQSERTVKQEIFAHFVLITLTRIFYNRAEQDLNPQNHISRSKEAVLVNFKKSLVTIARNLEALFLQQAEVVKKTVNRIMQAIGTCKQKMRPNRSYDRVSRKPISKWQPKKGSNTKAKEAIIEISS